SGSAAVLHSAVRSDFYIPEPELSLLRSAYHNQPQKLSAETSLFLKCPAYLPAPSCCLPIPLFQSSAGLLTPVPAERPLSAAQGHLCHSHTFYRYFLFLKAYLQCCLTPVRSEPMNLFLHFHRDTGFFSSCSHTAHHDQLLLPLSLPEFL